MADDEELESLMHRRAMRLVAIATELSALYGDLAQCQIAEAEQKAQLYLNYPSNISHGERQARASHETVNMDSEVRSLRAQIDQLKVEKEAIEMLIRERIGIAS